MGKEIIVDIGSGEKRVAVLEDGELVEIYMEKSDTERLVGNIYRGRVCSVLPGMQAAFVDIGYEKNAFLYVDDIIYEGEFLDTEGICRNKTAYNIDDILKPGQEITVQVIKESIGTKGPRVTTNITLPGRYLVLLPNADFIGVSRKIENGEERSKLKKTAEKLKPEGMGLVVRTASEGKDIEDFIEDTNYLLKLWDVIKRKEQKGHVPRCIHREMDLVLRTARDLFSRDVDKFVINDRKEYERVLELVETISPALKNRVEYFGKDIHIFEYYGIEPKIARMLSRKVWLKCGGYLVIDKTEALTVIDVNTGKYTGESSLEDTVLKTNIEAAKEIAKQLRLRDIGGIIIIDFIDMQENRNRHIVLDTLKEALKKDRTRTTVIGMTGLGLIEMTRKKVREELPAAISVECPCCEGTGRIIKPGNSGGQG